jgi:Rps23 Pro-64 3,4-dihydroxylase Tpa1-like proline 4-hydroxylase
MTIAADVLNKIPRYGVVRDWLGPQTVERLLQFVHSNEHRFVDSSIVSKGKGDRVDRTHRVSRKLPNFNNFNSELKSKLKSKDVLPLMFDMLGKQPFIPRNVEVELVAHGDGAFFGRHIDTRFDQKAEGRVISAVYYFHAVPKAFSGGVLRIHSLAASGQPGTFVDITPDYDTLVFFPSFFPHEVLPVKCDSGKFLDSRFAINLWIHKS